jgi:hypothetical protein
MLVGEGIGSYLCAALLGHSASGWAATPDEVALLKAQMVQMRMADAMRVGEVGALAGKRRDVGRRRIADNLGQPVIFHDDDQDVIVAWTGRCCRLRDRHRAERGTTSGTER